MSDWISLVFNVALPEDFGVDAMVVAVDSIGIAVVTLVMQTQLTVFKEVFEKRLRRSTIADVFDKSTGGFMFSGLLFYASVIMVLGTNLYPPGSDIATINLSFTWLSLDWSSLPMVLTIVGVLIQAALFLRYCIASYIFIPLRAVIEPFAVRVP